MLSRASKYLYNLVYTIYLLPLENTNKMLGLATEEFSAAECNNARATTASGRRTKETTFLSLPLRQEFVCPIQSNGKNPFGLTRRYILENRGALIGSKGESFNARTVSSS